MKRMITIFSIVCMSMIITIAAFIPGSTSAQEIRPIRDDIGYCWEPAQLERFMNFLKDQQAATTDETPLFVAGISPHDDYMYAGKTYYSLFSHLRAKEVVIFGVTHRSPRLKLGDPTGKLILDEFNAWQGPYGQIGVSALREYIKANLDKSQYIVSNEGHRMEHSIEGMLPFLQYFNRDVRITPIMVTGMPLETMKKVSQNLSKVLASYIKKNNLTLGKDIFFLISADANHYGKDFENVVFGQDAKAHKQGTDFDKQLAHTYLSGDIDETKVQQLTSKLWGKTFKGYGNTVWCGKYSIPVGLLTVLDLSETLSTGKQLKGQVLNYSDTYSEGVLPIRKTGMGITAPFSLKHWVGFFSAGFYY